MLFLLLAMGCGVGLDTQQTWSDEDQDGYPGFSDCDDADAEIHPFAVEVCDGLDNDCDGQIDEGDAEDAIVFYPDLDQDGYGDGRYPTRGCELLDGYVTDASDCDDVSAVVNPDGIEVCDGLDNDCDGFTDDDDVGLDTSTTQSFYVDADGDGYGDPEETVQACSVPAGAVAAGGEPDCDDGAADAHPGGVEVCGDGVDNDCDGTSNECGLAGAYDLPGDAEGSLWGEDSSDNAGYTVSGGGDLAGDDLGDVAVGAWYASPDGSTRTGAVYVVEGPITGSQDLSSAGHTLSGSSSSDYFGWAVATGGDVDGDGHGAILVGAPYDDSAGTDAGSAYLFEGPLDGSIAAADADVHFKSTGSSDYAGWSVALVSDLDDDGYDELAVGAYGDDDNGSSSGTVTILDGPISGSVTSASATATLLGETSSDYAGYGLANGGDTDGDGYGDLLVGAHGNDGNGSGSGAVYLVRGPAAGTIGLSAVSDVIRGAGSSYALGQAITGAGDLDGDGYDDIVVGCTYTDSYKGAAYVFYGPFSGQASVADADASITGSNNSDYLGTSVSIGGDADGDDRADLLVGALYGDGQYSDVGAAYLFSGPISGALVASSADASFRGADSSDYLGRSVALVDDTNGDVFDDLLMGAPGDDTWGSSSGVAFLVLGSGI